MSKTDTKLIDILNSKYEDFVSKLKVNLVDTKLLKLLSMGKKDGFPVDEVVEVQADKKIICRNLQPTQNQIGLYDSLGWISRNKPTEALNFLDGITKHYENDRILVANGKYIIDGHHRWAALTLFNPDAEMSVIDLKFSDNYDERQILKVVQLAIAVTYGDIAMSEAHEESDLFDPNLKGDKLRETIGSIMGKEMIETMKQGLGVVKNSEVIDYIYENALFIKSLKPDDAPKRSYMPQPTKTAKKVGREPSEVKNFMGFPKELIDTLQSGVINYKEPFRLKKESIKIKKFNEF